MPSVRALVFQRSLERKLKRVLKINFTSLMRGKGELSAFILFRHPRVYTTAIDPGAGPHLRLANAQRAAAAASRS